MAMLRRLPQSALSRVFGLAARLYLPSVIRRPVLWVFSSIVGIDRSEAELDLRSYPSIADFFVRRLRDGSRPLPEDLQAIISPVDGQLAEFGVIEDGRLLQAKGIHYSLTDLLDSADEAARFRHGSFATIYLSPRDYHRIHAPVRGALAWARHVPGRLLPVNRAAVALIPDLFVRNERLICRIDGDRSQGSVAVVAIGAFNVGSISSAFDPDWNQGRRGVTNRAGSRPETRSYEPPIEIERGEEVMAFHLGSTVVLIFENQHVHFSSELEIGSLLRFGQEIACP